MPRIPIQEVPNVGLQGGQSVPFQGQRTVPFQSAVPGQLQQLGQALQGLGQQQIQRAQIAQDDRDDAVTKDTSAKWMEFARQETNGFRSLIGGEATPQGKEASLSAITNKASEFLEAMENEVQRDQFKLIMDREMLAVRQRFDAHQFREARVHNIGRTEALEKEMIQGAINSFGEPTPEGETKSPFALAKDTALDQKREQARLKGVSPEERKRMLQETTGSIHAGVVDRRLSEGDVAGAQKYWDSVNQKNVDPSLASKITAVLGRANVGVAAQSLELQVAGVSSPPPTATADELTAIVAGPAQQEPRSAQGPGVVPLGPQTASPQGVQPFTPPPNPFLATGIQMRTWSEQQKKVAQARGEGAPVAVGERAASPVLSAEAQRAAGHREFDRLAAAGAAPATIKAARSMWDARIERRKKADAADAKQAGVDAERWMFENEGVSPELMPPEMIEKQISLGIRDDIIKFHNNGNVWIRDELTYLRMMGFSDEQWRGIDFDSAFVLFRGKLDNAGMRDMQAQWANANKKGTKETAQTFTFNKMLTSTAQKLGIMDPKGGFSSATPRPRDPGETEEAFFERMNKDNPLEERLNGLRLQNLHEEVQERMNLWRINHPKQEPDIAQLQEFFDDVLLQGNQLLLNGKPRLFGAMTDEEQLNAGLPFGPAGETLTLGSIPVDEFQRIEGSIRRVNKELELAGQTPRPVTQSLVLQEYAKKLAATKGARDARTNEETERIWAEWVKSGGLNR